MNNIINKLINSKIIWISLALILIILITILLIPNNNKEVPNNTGNGSLNNSLDEEIYFDLKGETLITLYIGEVYVEPGYTAYDKNFNDINSYVLVNGNVDTTKVGIYEISYILNYKEQEEQTLIRKIQVIERDYNDVVLKLNGDSTIYVSIDSDYEELGATAYINDYDISNEIMITSTVNMEHVGEYEVNYYIINDKIQKKLTRKVIVFDINNFFTISDLEFTNKDVVVNVNINNYFRYVVLPNKVVKMVENFDYNITENGNYQFVLYDVDGGIYTKEIIINNIDKIKPTGSCQAIIYNDRVEISTNAKDNSHVVSYRNIIDNEVNQLVYTNVYTSTDVNNAKNVSVEVMDKASNKTTLTCTILDEREPVFINGNRCSDAYIYEGTKYQLTDKQKRKLAAMVKAEYGGDLIGMKAVASHMANLYEYKKWRGATNKSFYSYITSTTWYASRTRNATSVNDNALKAVEDCIVNGQRTLPLYIDEFDWFPYDILSYKKPDYYEPGKTSIANKYGAKGIFWCLTIYSSGEGNVFFYSSNSYKKYIESKNQ